ncbi:sirohydrochlorin chelatase [Alkalihalobacillus oceani]|uniref:sirohydrochlorin chelatase n=1 Tax=Halalkalibacter oceani TaxID=1653776 RepID=UPI00203EF6C4|nr:sirohydrochlorin chelatase [Halalkalibacter oceani]MCM3760406.1 sirohydrochlorin chelatase [Halalkalibacter oceani]
MQAILYIGHGSRVQAGNDELRNFVEKTKAAHPQVAIQECCFLELADPDITEGVRTCIKQGATRIAVVPVLLLTAMHAKVDIPQEIERQRAQYPDVSFTYGRPMGIEATIIEIIKARLKKAGMSLTAARPRYEERQPVSLLLVGRGSSDPEATSDLMKIARLVWEFTPVTDVEVCFMAATHPNVEEGLARVTRLPNETVYVIPYLLFTGVLMETLEKQLAQWSKRTEKSFILCDYLGFDDRLVDVLAERVQEALEAEPFPAENLNRQWLQQ